MTVYALIGNEGPIQPLSKSREHCGYGHYPIVLARLVVSDTNGPNLQRYKKELLLRDILTC